VSVTATGAGISPQNVAVTFNIAAAPPVNGITVVAVGNLGRCGGELGKQSANAVAAMNPPPDYILMLGNSALPQTGKVTTYDDYIHCYDPVWGKWKSITYAVLGDHELDIDTVPPTYGTGMALGADAYFGPDRIGPPGKNWYSFDLGSWHIVALNIQSPGGYTRPIAIQFHAGSDQMNWLENDLSAHSNKCTLAFWYQAMWFSSKNIDPSWEPKIVNGDTLYKDGYRIQDIRGIWRTLYNGNADLVVNGTPHIYERFAPMDYGGTYKEPTATEYRADSVRGVREIISGLGGDGPTTYDQPAAVRHPLSEFRAGGNGVLKLVLGDGEYSWEFINTPYSQIHDSGHGVCH
jgi:hypothetical protein